MSPLPPRLRIGLATALAVVAVGGGCLAWTGVADDGPRPDVVAEHVRLQMPAVSPAVAAVYAARDGQPLWLDPTARAAAIALLADAGLEGLTPETFGVEALAMPPIATDSAAAVADVALTTALLRFGDSLAVPRVDAVALYGASWTPSTDTVDAAARFVATVAPPGTDAGAAVRAWADGLRPPDAGYRALRGVLVRETRLEARPDLVLRADLAPGDTGAAVIRLRERLAVEAEARGTVHPASDAPRAFDPALSDALAAVQRAHDLPDTGRLDAPTRDALNRRQTEVLPLVRLNLERWRWLPRRLGALHVWVNLPEFEIAVRERAPDGWHDRLRSRAVIGQRSWRTPVFSDTMETVVFNPTWLMPASIQREAYGHTRRGPILVDPGPGNALGRVKFLFPNPHAVYLHDTPSKWAFDTDDRARSHGCVRVGDPRDLATAVLTRTNGWAADSVAAYFDGPWRLQEVALDRGVPVHLVYFTASADAAGRVTVWRDVYGHDARLADALGLSLDGVPPPTPRPDDAPAEA